ncbi:hypothetical protein GGI15_002857 [Coemansia interrupta]|uniref:aminodeoxychorismate synthase n=1 Tax=Coemansia interrupta TaxID=1126814 RepID=A0A9W8HHJ2_9FUNG|nr:hypothetical protein GGI15_002857 [Coemansia interrupta]
MPSTSLEHSSFPRTLLVDNYDSYTFNVLQLLTAQCLKHNADPAAHILVIRNDQHAWPTVRDLILPHIDNIVISPGPGTPARAEDFGVCTQLISAGQRPLLGVCLGHQGIALAFGAHVRRSGVAVHGQTGTVEVERPDEGLFEGVPRRFAAVRYHSLAVADEGFPHGELEVLARASGSVKAWVDGRVADVATREIMALRHRRRPLFGVQFHPESVCSEHGARLVANFHAITCGERSVSHGGLPQHVRAMSLQAADAQTWRRGVGQAAARWRLVEQTVELAAACRLDALFGRLFGGSRMPVWLDSADAGGRGGGMSVMAAACGPGSATVRYSVATREVEVLAFAVEGSGRSVLASAVLDGADEGSFWAWMQRVADCTSGVAGGGGAGFVGGWVGYFGYEMRAECMGMAAEAAEAGGGRLPDAHLAFVDRCVVVDHTCSPPRAHVRALVANGCPDGAPAWTARLGFASHGDASAWVSATSAAIARPERFQRVTAVGDGGERVVEMRPIKGTCRRDPHGDPAEDRRRREALQGDAKERAEHLMIVDLIRHDLGWIARAGSVAVAGLMEIESYATVHQMVSTVQARLPAGGMGSVGVLAHCFPPGSMTGAPKRRTTQIIDALERRRRRGVYSGCLGYFSACGAQSDWSVVIRTAVVDGRSGRVDVGAGGALTALSQPAAEWAEVETKLHAALRGVERYVAETG